MIYLILGHSGSGKSTIRDILTSHGLKKIVTYTTREPRPNEIDGVDYNFISLENFQKFENKNLFIGTTCYAGNFYSTLKKDLEENNNKNKNCIIIVDKEGVIEIKKYFPNAISIYLKCSKEILIARMKKRRDSKKEIEKRLSVMEDLDDYADYIVDGSKNIDLVLEDFLKIIKNSHKNFD